MLVFFFPYKLIKTPLNIIWPFLSPFQKEKKSDVSPVVLLVEFDETVRGTSENKQVDPVENCVDFNFTCYLTCSHDVQTLTNIAQKPIICKMSHFPKHTGQFNCWSSVSIIRFFCSHTSLLENRSYVTGWYTWFWCGQWQWWQILRERRGERRQVHPVKARTRQLWAKLWLIYCHFYKVQLSHLRNYDSAPCITLKILHIFMFPYNSRMLQLLVSSPTKPSGDCSRQRGTNFHRCG